MDVPEGGTKEVEEVQQAVKYSSLFPFMLKPPSLLIQGFKDNNKAQYNLLNGMCNFGAHAVWRNGRRAANSYLGVETSKYQCPIQPLWTASQVT